MRVSFVLVLCLAILTSCKKYEEGPVISFRSKTKRLEGSWQIVKWKINGTEQDLSQTSWRMNIHRSGNYDKLITYNIPPLPPTIDSEQGTWEFDNNKTHVDFMDQVTEAVTSLEIIRLHNKELWLRFNDGIVSEEYQYSSVE